jgi:fructoselysine-6-P-deglycase FrlB-like protein
MCAPRVPGASIGAVAGSRPEERDTMPDGRLDPAAPLSDAPDPWEGSTTPSRRDGPPFHMTEMIAAEPALAARVLDRLAVPDGEAARLAAVVRGVAASGGPIAVVGCGTSEHGALGVADVLRDALRRTGLPARPGLPLAVQALEFALDPQRGGLVIGVSHEGGTWATNRALEAARAAGATTALVTVSERSPGAALADIVIRTGEMDESWCHTVGYVSPLLAATAVGAEVSDRPVGIDDVTSLMEAGLGRAGDAEAIADALHDAATIVVIGSGADRTAGRELVLKIEEATWLPSAYRDLETMLHGHLPATDATTGMIVILADRDGRDERVERARELLDAASVIGIRSAAILAEEAAATIDSVLMPAGRIVVPEAPTLPAPVAALLGTAIPLQLVTERLARARGTNPDPIRRDDPRYREAADRAR